MLPALKTFRTAYSDATMDLEEGQAHILQAIWLEAEGLLQHTFTSQTRW